MGSTPDCLKRRSLLNDPNAEPENLVRLGLEFAEQGFICDAADFFERAGDRERLTELSPGLLEEGDVFLFTRIKKILGEAMHIKEWRSLAENASKLGKEAFAAQAAARAEEVEALVEVGQAEGGSSHE